MAVMNRKLRVVGPNDPAPVKPRNKTILEAAESGSRLEELLAMRRRLAKAMDDPNTLARDLASLSRRQLEISREVEELTRQAEEAAEEDAVTPDEEWTAI